MADELQHYGVLGMRWGIRRVQKNLKREVAGGNPSAKRTLDKTKLVTEEFKNARANKKQANKNFKTAKRRYKIDKELSSKLSGKNAKEMKRLAIKEFKNAKAMKRLAATSYKTAIQKYRVEIELGEAAVSEFLKNQK